MPTSCRTVHARAVALVALVALVSAIAWLPGEAGAAAVPNLVSNPSLERATGSFPDCFEAGGYGDNAARFERSSRARTGGAAQTVTITSLTSGDRKVVTRMDAGQCAPRVTPGRRYRASLYYNATVSVRVAVYYRGGSGQWMFWAKGSAAPRSGTWREASFVTPPVPTSATRLSFGISIESTGIVTADDFALTESNNAVIFADTFSNADELVTNEFAHWNPSNPTAVHSVSWDMTSGSLWQRNRAGYTGASDARSPDAKSSKGNNSAVFRLTTKRNDLGDVAVSMRLRNDGLTTTPRTPATDWDGVHVFLRYQNEASLYYASVNRRDNTIAVKKKVPEGPSNGGTYYTLATSKHVVPYGSWQAVLAQIRTNDDGSVTITLSVDGTRLVTATDAGVGGPPIDTPGAVGIRGDNASFYFDDFVVSSL